MMIEYHYESDFKLENEIEYSDWISRVLISEKTISGILNYIFCDDEYLLNINRKYLKHDTYTDIITFDYSDGNVISGDVFISVERVKENAKKFDASFEEELKRVMVHGLLHLMGYNDKASDEKVMMRKKENENMKLFHVEQ